MTDITLPGYYIIERTYTHEPSQSQYTKRQYVKLENTITGNKGQTLYTGWYGFHSGFHEVCSPIENIKPLTKEQLAFHEKNEYWNLPQDFYQ
tara:strand:+ start:607 stop:882 length:276 start_codon:yes stop_codon:yes gene_type:complete